MDVRTFKLYNSKGSELDLMSKSHFLSSPSGLGYSRNNTFRQVGERFILVSSKQNQGTIEGTIILAPSDIYKNYQELVSFLSYSPLQIKYTPYTGGGDYFRDVVVSKLEKTEIDKNGYMSCPISFQCITPWYRKYYSASGNSSSGGLAWIWEVTFDTGFSSGQDMVIEFDSDSRLDSPCKVSIHGPIANPRWEHRVNGSLVGQGKINTTVPAGYNLIISNLQGSDIGIYATNGTLIRSVYGLADFTKDRFITIKNGRNAIRFYGDNSEVVPIRAEGRLYYESV